MTVETTFISTVYLLLLLPRFLKPSLAANPHHCSSSCGIFPNITHPFRLKSDPKECGDTRFEFECKNNFTFFYRNSHQYYVKEIYYGYDYGNYVKEITLVDASLNNDDICSFPDSSSYGEFDSPYLWGYEGNTPVHFMSCPHPLNGSSNFTAITHCNSSHPGFRYIKVGSMKALELPETCDVDAIVMTSWPYFGDANNVSLSEIHRSLLYGFKVRAADQEGYTTWHKIIEFIRDTAITFLPILIIIAVVIVGPMCPAISIIGYVVGFGLIIFQFSEYTSNYYSFGLLRNYEDYPSVDPLRVFKGDPWISYDPRNLGFHTIIVIICAPRIIISSFLVWIFVYKFRRRNRSSFDTIERFLQSDNKLAPIRYSYSEVRKMTRGFRDKLGEGGYGSVYRGKLRSGHHVAVKMLGKSGANGQDFINEIATIGRIHHVNIVKLVGYCAQNSKRALVFDFMPNGSLEKYIFNRDKMNSLNWDKKFDIVVGVARGIEYLHRGCDIQILHFDIKPHNILLDEKFIPKISDFGLAKFCSTDKNTMTLTAARGTIGYVAPELINRGIGRVSHKADVYSFGMLLIDMVGLKTDLKGNDDDDSTKYFPCWIYDRFNKGMDIEIGDFLENNNNDDYDNMRELARKMAIVALWCIQMNPDDRPPMNKVLKMLEGEVKHLKIPQYSSEAPCIVASEDETWGIGSSNSASSLLHHTEAHIIEINIEG